MSNASLALLEARTAEILARRRSEQAQAARYLQSRIAEALLDDEKSGKRKLVPKNFKDVYIGLKIGIQIEREVLGLKQKSSPSVNIINH